MRRRDTTPVPPCQYGQCSQPSEGQLHGQNLCWDHLPIRQAERRAVVDSMIEQEFLDISRRRELERRWPRSVLP